MQTFEWIRSGLEIEELIYENIESDNDWKDLSLTTGLESKLIRISNKNETLESKGRYLWYMLMQQQRLLDKNKKIKNVAKGIPKIMPYFSGKKK